MVKICSNATPKYAAEFTQVTASKSATVKCNWVSVEGRGPRSPLTVMAAPNSTPPASAPPTSNGKRFLIVFDFDETIIAENSDDAVVRAAPGQRLPDWLTASYREGHYNEHMQRVLAYLAEQGVAEDAIRAALEKIPPTPGLAALFHFLRTRQDDYEAVVVSDANTYFIETWLRRFGARPLFRQVFTNPAGFDAAGRLVLRPFHAHGCARCPDNMCKQVIVREYLARRREERSGRAFQQVLYVGDGANDVCPSLALGPGDVVFPRRDFPMHRLLEGAAGGVAGPGPLKARVVPWSSGEDVVACLQTLDSATTNQSNEEGDV
ncbi:putative phosphatase phospho1 [Merluccius polli]|uniref:Phosphatase phospho1 n=1 Tax=Merluccius polli TaxID=89951 RepID=A0AA47NE05_MERPO|nr:putative phosphatase phospho1 [Merluccius polli]